MRRLRRSSLCAHSHTSCLMPIRSAKTRCNPARSAAISTKYMPIAAPHSTEACSDNIESLRQRNRNGASGALPRNACASPTVSVNMDHVDTVLKIKRFSAANSWHCRGTLNSANPKNCVIPTKRAFALCATRNLLFVFSRHPSHTKQHISPLSFASVEMTTFL
jgi:hypothetical protein